MFVIWMEYLLICFLLILLKSVLKDVLILILDLLVFKMDINVGVVINTANMVWLRVKTATLPALKVIKHVEENILMMFMKLIILVFLNINF
jgi:hypothetical protein